MRTYDQYVQVPGGVSRCSVLCSHTSSSVCDVLTSEESSTSIPMTLMFHPTISPARQVDDVKNYLLVQITGGMYAIIPTCKCDKIIWWEQLEVCSPILEYCRQTTSQSGSSRKSVWWCLRNFRVANIQARVIVVRPTRHEFCIEGQTQPKAARLCVI